MHYTMGELLAMSEERLEEMVSASLYAEKNETTRKQAIIAALSVLRGEPAKATPLAEMFQRAAAKARQDGD